MGPTVISDMLSLMLVMALLCDKREAWALWRAARCR